MKKIKIDYDSFIESYERNKWKPSSIAKDLKVNPSVVKRIMKQYNLEPYTVRTSKDRFKEAIVNTNGTVIDIARYLDITERNVYSLSSKYNIKLKKVKSKRVKTPSYISKEDILSVYEETKGIPNRIALKLKKSVSTVIKYMDLYSIQKKYKQNVYSKEEVNDLYCKHNKNATAMANDSSVSLMTMLSYMKQYGFEIQKTFSVSKYETELYEYLKNHNINVINSDKSMISPYELDILLPDYNLAIELNGLRWHSEQFGKDSKYHKNKTELCKQKGIQLMHVFEDEWVNSSSVIKNLIHAELNNTLYTNLSVSEETDISNLKDYCIKEVEIDNILSLYNNKELISYFNFSNSKGNIIIKDFITKSYSNNVFETLFDELKKLNPSTIELSLDLRFHKDRYFDFFNEIEIGEPICYYTNSRCRVDYEPKDDGWFKIWNVGYINYKWSYK